MSGTAPMRIGFVSSGFAVHDGWGRYSRELLGALVQAGVSPIVVTTPGADVDTREGVEVHRVLPEVPFGTLVAWRQLVAVPAVGRALVGADAVHLTIEPFLPLVASAMHARQPLVLTAHGTYAVHPFARRSTRWLYARGLERVDLVVCQSEATRRAMASVTKLPASVVLPGGVAPDDLDGKHADGKAPLDDACGGDIPAGARVVLTVGAVKRRKGHDSTLAALAHAATLTGPLHWVVVGDTSADPAWFASLSARGRDAGHVLHVHWRGRVSEPELRAWYRRASLLVHLPSDGPHAFEGLGLVFLEAAAHGVAAVTWAGSGAEEAVRHARTGLVVARGDTRAAGDAVAKLIADDRERARFGAAARTLASERTWTTLASRLVDHYRRLVQVRRSAGGGGGGP